MLAYGEGQEEDKARPGREMHLALCSSVMHRQPSAAPFYGYAVHCKVGQATTYRQARLGKKRIWRRVTWVG
jgi:hypothetical protein